MSGLTNVEMNKYFFLKHNLGMFGPFMEMDPLFPNKNDLSIRTNRCHWYQNVETWIPKVIQSVKETIRNSNTTTCEISLQPNLFHPTTDDIESPPSHFFILGLANQWLYRKYGIEIQKIDNSVPPKKLVVVWHHDHPEFLLAYLEKLPKDEIEICTLKYKNRTFHLSKPLITAKLQHVKTAEIELDDLEEETVSKFRHYLLSGQLTLEGCSIEHIDGLLSLSSSYQLPYLQQLCFEHLCKQVDVNNFENYISLARKHQSQELERSLSQNLQTTFSFQNIEKVLQQACTQKQLNLEQACQDWFEPTLQQIEQIINRRFTIEENPKGLFEYELLLDIEGHQHQGTFPNTTTSVPSSKQSGIFFERYKLSPGQHPSTCHRLCRFNRIVQLLKLLQLGVKYQSTKIVKACVDQMQKISESQEKQLRLRNYVDLLVVCNYFTPHLNWWPQTQPNPLQAFKNRLLQRLPGELELNATFVFLAASYEKIQDLKNICLPIITTHFDKMQLYPSTTFSFFKHLFTCMALSSSEKLFQIGLERLKEVAHLSLEELQQLLTQLHSNTTWNYISPSLQTPRYQIIEQLDQIVWNQFLAKLQNPYQRSPEEDHLNLAMTYYLKHPNSCNPSHTFARIEHLQYLLSLAQQHSKQVVAICTNHVDTLYNSLNDNTGLISLLDGLILSHFLKSGLQTQKQQTQMQMVKQRFIDQISTLISMKNIDMLTKIATQFSIQELSTACQQASPSLSSEVLDKS